MILNPVPDQEMYQIRYCARSRNVPNQKKYPTRKCSKQGSTKLLVFYPIFLDFDIYAIWLNISWRIIQQSRRCFLHFWTSSRIFFFWIHSENYRSKIELAREKSEVQLHWYVRSDHPLSRNFERRWFTWYIRLGLKCKDKRSILRHFVIFWDFLRDFRCFETF